MGDLPEIIYVLDDNHSFLKATVRLLQASGIPAEGFLSGQDLAERYPFPEQTCLIIDIVLGRENGLDVMQDLHDRGGMVPVVFVSATENTQFLARAEQMTNQPCLQKPFVADALFTAVRHAMRRVEESEPFSSRDQASNLR